MKPVSGEQRSGIAALPRSPTPRPWIRAAAVFTAVALWGHAGCAAAGEPSSTEAAPSAVASCRARPEYRRLDFWIGRWNVYEGTELAGTNLIESVAAGCAVRESWRDRDGHVGSSWFYFDPVLRLWKQVWIAEQAWRLGGTKEKIEAPGTREAQIRFQGVLVDATGKRTLDRTTLHSNRDGTVHQLIEWSVDDGRSWRVVFDARYVSMLRAKVDLAG